MAQLVKHSTPDTRSGCDLPVMRSRPSGSALTVWSLLEILDLSLSLSAPPPQNK